MKGLPLQVKSCLDKALDSALLAVETYNNLLLNLNRADTLF